VFRVEATNTNVIVFGFIRQEIHSFVHATLPTFQMWHTCTQPSWLPYRLTYYNIPVLNASWLPYRLTYYNIPILNASWLPYKLAYYNSNVLKFFLEGVIDPFHLEYFIKTFVQANHPRFKLELKCIFLKRGQNVGEFVSIYSFFWHLKLFFSDIMT
jgi:hypothetical protein